MIYRCRVCNQPICREMAIPTLAGKFTDGYCQKHQLETPDVSSGPLVSTPLNNGLNEKGGQDGENTPNA